jgi:hypothetical protein
MFLGPTNPWGKHVLIPPVPIRLDPWDRWRFLPAAKMARDRQAMASLVRALLSTPLGCALRMLRACAWQ